MKRNTIAILIAVILIFSLAGCSAYDKLSDLITQNLEQSSDDVKSSENDNTVVANTIAVGIYDFDTFNPLVTLSESVKEAMEFVYEPLFELNEYLQAEPILAVDYGMSADGKTIIINLKDNVLWHDGTQMTAYDVIYTIDCIKNAKTTYTELLEDVVSYSAVDSYQITVNFNHPIPNASALFTFPVVKNGTDMINSKDYEPIGTGAFAYSGKISMDRYMLNAFDYYYNGRANLDGVYIDMAQDPERYEYMYSAGVFDVSTSRLINLKTYTPKGSVILNEFVSQKMTYIGFNYNIDELLGSNTRNALSDLINREHIVSSILYSRAEAADIPINPASLMYTDIGEYGIKEKEAEEHLKIDGWSAKDMGGYSRTVNGEYQELAFKLLVNSDDIEKVEIAKSISDSFNLYGIKISLEQLPAEEYNQRINDKQYDMFLGECIMPATQDVSYILDGNSNIFGYKNEELDTLMTQIGMTSGQEELQVLYTQLADLLRKETPLIVISYSKECMLNSPKLKNIKYPGTSRFYRDVKNWSVK